MLSASIPDTVSLAWGLPSFQTPGYIREAVKKALDTDTDAGKYTLPDGLPAFRNIVAQVHKEKTGVTVSADANVMTAAGNMQALNTLFHTMLDPGDEIILTDPCFASHIQQIHLFNGIPRYWPLDEQNNWSLNLETLPSLINEKTQAIVLVSPSNPTGKVFSRDELTEVASIAKAHEIFLIIDDPYSDFVYDGEHSAFNPAGLEEFQDYVVYLYTFSKAYAMSGWRLAYMILPEELKYQALKVHDATMICAPRISQLAGIAALTEKSDHIENFRHLLKQRRELICQRLDALSGIFSYQRPEGAYYVFPRIEVAHQNSRDFALDLLHNARVTVTPGSAFGPSGESHVRMAYCVDEDTINRAFDRMEQYFR